MYNHKELGRVLETQIDRLIQPLATRRNVLRLSSITLITAVLFVFNSVGMAQEKRNRDEKDLTSLSLDELLNVEVTSASKHEETLYRTAAAVYVITQDEIRRSGLSSIPDILRLAPGLDVARIDGTKWAISARGFNGRAANKLLVLIDGRSIYSIETAGVYWEVQDLLVEDIERIEVIRGPGGTLWGANAVNGVINIITKRSQDTQGGMLTASVGMEERASTSFRYGSKIGDNAFYRVYGKWSSHQGLVDSTGNDTDDGHGAVRGGIRLDWKPSSLNFFTIEGNLYRSKIHEYPSLVLPGFPFAPVVKRDGEFLGGDFLTRWSRTYSSRSQTELQVAYDYFNRNIFALPERVHTIDVGFQHHFTPNRRHDFLWGIDWRLTGLHSGGTDLTPIRLDPPSEKSQLLGLFAQDEITLISDRLRLTVGAKVEHYQESESDESHGDLQPGIRLLWTPREHETIWGAVSRAVRTLASVDSDLRANLTAFPTPNGIPGLAVYFGNDEFKAETLVAYEAGYRAELNEKLSLDLAAFFNAYDRLKTEEPGEPFFEPSPTGHIVFPLTSDNLMRGNTYGLEASANIRLNADWKLKGSYSLLQLRMHPYAESRDTTTKTTIEGGNPQHQFQLHSYLRLPRNFELDASAYFVSGLPALGVPHYTRLDVRFGRQISERFEFNVVGQDLLQSMHPEYSGNDTVTLSHQVKRGLFAELTWRF